MDYSIYDRNGRIVSMVGCSPDELDAAIAAAGGEGALEGVFHWSSHYVQDGAATAFPAKPSADHDWDWSVRAWRQPDPAKLQERRLQEVAAARRSAYPPIGDQLDAIWKELSLSRPQSPEGQAMLDRILAVKAAHPNPPNNK